MRRCCEMENARPWRADAGGQLVNRETQVMMYDYDGLQKHQYNWVDVLFMATRVTVC